MRNQINQTLEALKADNSTYKRLEEATGIHHQTIRKIALGQREMTVSELLTLADHYSIIPPAAYMTVTSESLEQMKKEAQERAFMEVYNAAEAKLAEKYGITQELLVWRLSAPVKKAV
jgi:transcriptional regulator with XRE-family HTH domain